MAQTTTKRKPPQLYQQQRRIMHNQQSTLHDFPFPVLKTWDRQHLLRCAKVPPDHNERASTVSGITHNHQVKDDDGVEKIRVKLTGHLSEAAGRMEFKSRLAPTPNARRLDAAATTTVSSIITTSATSSEEEVAFVGSKTGAVVPSFPLAPDAPVTKEYSPLQFPMTVDLLQVIAGWWERPAVPL